MRGYPFAPRIRARTLALFVLAAVAPAVASCRTEGTAPTSPAQPTDTVHLGAEARDKMGIELVAAKTVRWADRTEAVGTVVLDERRTARLGAPLEGRVAAVLAEVGDMVRAGQVLAHISSPAWQEARAALRKATAEEAAARQEVAYTNQVLARARRLYDAQALSRQEVEKAALDRVMAHQRLRAARAELARAREQVRQLAGAWGDAVEDEELLPVVSPVAGVLLERNVNLGSAVTPGTPLFVVSDLSSLWLIAEIPETELGRLDPGGEAAFQVAAYPGERFRAQVESIGDVLDPHTRRLRVRCRVDNHDRRLKPNMFATLEIGAARTREALAVPETALQQWDGVPVVFVAEGGDAFRRRPVTVGQVRDGLAEILAGLQEGDTVVARGSFLLKSALVLQLHPEAEE